MINKTIYSKTFTSEQVHDLATVEVGPLHPLVLRKARCAALQQAVEGFQPLGVPF
jgi:hypothetical protein